jgi:hypothetical protein
MKTTEVVVDKQPTESQIRIKVQAVLQKNLRTPLGMFHGKELNERGFVNDLFKNFDITPKKDEK